MKLNLIRYLIAFLLFTNCRISESEVKNYGSSESKSSEVSLNLTEFENYGIFLDKIREVVCDDSIPKIVIERKDITKNIYPIEYCEPSIYDPKGKHYVTFRNGEFYNFRSLEKIKIESLGEKLKNDCLSVNRPKSD